MAWQSAMLSSILMNFSKHYSSCSRMPVIIFFSMPPFPNAIHDTPYKSYVLAFWNSKFKRFKKIQIIFPQDPMKISKTLHLLQFWFSFNQIIFFLYLICNHQPKVTDWHFWSFKFKLLKPFCMNQEIGSLNGLDFSRIYWPKDFRFKFKFKCI